MSKNVLILSTTFRRGGNSEVLAREFARGAKKAGHQVEIVALREKTVGFCIGCLACQKSGRCVIPDDANAIAQKMAQADVLVFSTPVYFGGISGQMKTLLDRSNPCTTSDYAFRDVYLLVTAGEEENSRVDSTVDSLQGWVDCFDRAHLRGVVRTAGVRDAGDIARHPSLTEAQTLGKNL